MSEKPIKRTWVLGAGFSYPLGAPLFKDLFTLAGFQLGWAQIAMLGKKRSSSGDYNVLVDLMDHMRVVYGTHLIDGTPKSAAGLWRNPEHFLQRINDVLEYYGENSVEQLSLATSINRTIKDAFKSISPIAIHMGLLESLVWIGKLQLALEVSSFTECKHFSGEAWYPYLQWANVLTEHDTIVSFNYDTAVECLFREIGQADRLAVPLPDSQLSNPGSVYLYKLHGSTNWAINKDNGRYCNSGSVADIIDNEHQEVGISVPGPSKIKMRESELWARAMQAVSSADELHIIGYSFPQTDVLASRDLLSAIISGKRKTISITLGDDYSRFSRIKSFLSVSSETSPVKFTELFAEQLLIRFVEETRNT